MTAFIGGGAFIGEFTVYKYSLSGELNTTLRYKFLGLEAKLVLIF